MWIEWLNNIKTGAISFWESIDVSKVVDLFVYDGQNPLMFNTGLFLFLFVEKYAILVLRPRPPTLFGREVLPNGVYFHIYPVRRSECSILLHLQVA